MEKDKKFRREGMEGLAALFQALEDGPPEGFEAVPKPASTILLESMIAGKMAEVSHLAGAVRAFADQRDKDSENMTALKNKVPELEGTVESLHSTLRTTRSRAESAEQRLSDARQGLKIAREQRDGYFVLLDSVRSIVRNNKEAPAADIVQALKKTLNIAEPKPVEPSQVESSSVEPGPAESAQPAQ